MCIPARHRTKSSPAILVTHFAVPVRSRKASGLASEKLEAHLQNNAVLFLEVNRTKRDFPIV